MAGGEQELQRQRNTYTVAQQQRDEQLLRGDKQAFARYQQDHGQEFQASAKKTTARNYRDYEIYRSLQVPEAQAYGKRQEAADHITECFRQLVEWQDPVRMNLPGQTIPAKDVLMHLCRSRLLEKEIDADTMKTLTDHLTAGRMWAEGENPNAREQRRMNEAGMEALQEIYAKHLAALDKKYGEKLAKLTPSQYIQAMPALEEDLCVVGDMKRFFDAYQTPGSDPEQIALIKKKITFYADVWQVLRDRERLYIEMDPETITEKGELAKSEAEDYQKRLRGIREQAKKSGAFKTWKGTAKKLSVIFEDTKKIKTAAAQAQEEAQAHTNRDADAEAFSQDAPIPYEDAKRIAFEGAEISKLTSQNPEDRPESIPQVMELLKAMKKIRDFKAAQPDYYRLGQSYTDYVHCEGVLRMLPVLEETFTLYVRMQHLDIYGRTREDEITRRELEQRFEERRNACTDLYRASMETENDTRQRMKEELGSGLRLIEKKREFLAGRQEALPEVLLYSTLYSSALSFIELPEEGQEVPGLEDTLRKDAQRIRTLTDHTDACKEAERTGEATEVAPTGEVTEAALNLLRRFHGRYDAIMHVLDTEGTFSDSCLLEHRSELEQCALMADFLNKHLKKNKLKDKLMKQLKGDALAAADLELLGSMEEQMTCITSLFRIAQGIMLSQAHLEGLERVTFCGAEGEAQSALTPEEMLRMAKNLMEQNRSVQYKLQAASMEEKKAAELRELEIRTRVQNAVGREWIASARKGADVRHTAFTDYIGNGLGKPLHFFSWLLRKKRSMNHGAVYYQQARDMYLKTFVDLQDQQSVLNDWGRGDGEYAPKVELRKYYSSPLKITIKEMLRDANEVRGNYDFSDESFAHAIEAMNCYCRIEGIVNADTTEMEMAFLDTFQKQAAIYRENHEGMGQAPEIQNALQLLHQMQGQLDQNLRGTLADTMSEEELRLIKDKTVAYVEDTTYSSNIEESNIQDIPLFLHEPNINDVRQSTIGDCWLVSAIGSVVKTNPAFIRSMFQDLGNGDVIVRLFSAVDAQGNNVSYKEDLWNEGVHFQPAYFKLRKHYETGWGNASDCPWVQLLEKAYALGGYNTRNIMEVRGDRLYNVPDELTMGQIHQAVAHLTGHLPEGVPYKEEIVPDDRLDLDVCSGMVAGLPEREAVLLEMLLNGYPISYEKKEKQTCAISYESFRTYMLSEGCREQVASAWRSARKLPDDAKLDERDMHMAIGHYWAIVRRNLQRMMNGEELPFARHQQPYKREETAVGPDGLSKIDHRMMYARSGQYSLPVMRTILKFRRCIEEGGCVSVSIPHCVSILDVKEHEGKWFFLMRDPFNIYNTEYTKKGKEVDRSSDGFGSVFTGQNGNRHLQSTREETVRGGFRGTSWIEAQEIYDQLSGAYLIKPEYTQIPDYR